MKKACFIVLFAGYAGIFLFAQESCTPDSVVAVDGFSYLHRYENIYIGGQPDREQLTFMHAKGVRHVVNLRTDKENRKFERKNFDQAAFADSLDMIYRSVPVGGGKKDAGYDKLGAIAEVLNTNEKVLLHCKTGARARYILSVYLVREKGCPHDSAVAIAKEMGYYFPLEMMFGNELK